MSKHTVLVTGAAGYVGAMLVMRFAKRDDVEKVIGIDKGPIALLIRPEKKLIYLNTNTADDWEEKVREHHPDIVIHAAWQIRELFNAEDLQWQWNISGSDKVFQYALHEPEVTHLVHFSTVASYGAYPDNSCAHAFTEDEPLRESTYRYAEEKRIAESRLLSQYESSDKKTVVSVVRPASVTGPHGRFQVASFGLQSAMTGTVHGSWLQRLAAHLVKRVPVTPHFARQFIHEDDICAAVEKLAFREGNGYEVYNLCPPGPIVQGEEMAKAVGKKVRHVSPQTVRIVFWFAWRLTRGRVPTAPGSWKTFSYPVIVDGSKITRDLGFTYRYGSLEAFSYTDGEYENDVPETLRKHAPNDSA